MPWPKAVSGASGAKRFSTGRADRPWYWFRFIWWKGKGGLLVSTPTGSSSRATPSRVVSRHQRAGAVGNVPVQRGQRQPLAEGDAQRAEVGQLFAHFGQAGAAAQQPGDQLIRGPASYRGDTSGGNQALPGKLSPPYTPLFRWQPRRTSARRQPGWPCRSARSARSWPAGGGTAAGNAAA